MDIFSTVEQEMAVLANKFFPKHQISDVYSYALFPPGKLFRPKLLLAIAQDHYKDYDHNDLLVACFTEFHHAYTLVHDDLPSLDNDAFRRGKASLHAKHGEWRAVLTGDALLSSSYRILAELKTPYLSSILKLCTHMLGPKGLIQGQIIDMANEANNLEELTQMHRLKTSRLIQIATLAPLILRGESYLTQNFRDSYRLGDHIGIIFQFIDDLKELSAEKLSEHEASVNPYLKFADAPLYTLESKLKFCSQYLKQKKLKQTQKMLFRYLDESFSKIKEKSHFICLHTKIDQKNLNQWLEKQIECLKH